MMKRNLKLLALLMLAVPLFVGCGKEDDPEDKDDNPVPMNIVIDENITTDYTFVAKNTYTVTTDIYVGSSQGVTITFEPGTTVKFDDDASFNFGYYADEYATVIAKGTVDSVITFTSSSPAPVAGAWESLYFYKGANASELNYCTFQYGGSYEYYGMVTIADCAVALNNCTFKHSGADGVSVVDNGEFGAFANNSFMDNALYPIDINESAVHTIEAGNTFDTGDKIYVQVDDKLDNAGDVVWKNHGVPYTISSDLYVGSTKGTNLILEAGVSLNFNGDALYIAYYSEDYGKLITQGTAESPVVLTSNSPSPAKGDWNGVYFYAGSNGSDFTYCEINYAGQDEYYGAVYLEETGADAVTFTNAKITYSKGVAITYYGDASADISSVTFENNEGDDYVEL